ncbi:DUF3127 domain-containing protein [Fulvivirgaceae bacterium BMA10]|uniref:DUF3127 domain-containing protein n=1 Tax=Splendidivirga corallicola TaxID=3051826 RepID=A0ABT8KXP6_9BACT|nr:DUF3127 domain-containing protein [Fulvivirgaceae bacterium BMA10]
MDIKGKIIEIFETQKVTETFKKREFVVEYAENPQYPEFVKFELIQDKCDLLDQFNAGDEANISFNLKGRKWTDPKGEVKYFNSLQAWRLQKAENAEANDSNATPGGIDSLQEPEWLNDDKGDQDALPF